MCKVAENAGRVIVGSDIDPIDEDDRWDASEEHEVKVCLKKVIPPAVMGGG